MFKKVLHSSEGRNEIKKGVDAVANAARVTLGGLGRNVIITDGYGAPLITKDGVTVCRSITLDEPVVNAGANLIKEAAGRTLDTSGDGTTTASILTQSIINRGLEAMDQGANPVDLKKGIERGVELVCEKLKSLSKPINNQETLIQIATISANNDQEIGKLIADVFTEVGAEGKIDISDSPSHLTYTESVNGMKIDRGYTNPVFINNAKRRVCEFENPLILVSDRKVQTMKELLPFFEKSLSTGRPLLMIVDQLDGEAASLIYRNKQDGKLNCCVVYAPGTTGNRETELEDIAILTGATFISDKKGMVINKAELKDCGSAEKVIVEEKSTLFINGAGNALKVEERCDVIRQQLEETPEGAKEYLSGRLAKMIGKVGSIKVGGITQVEQKERKARVDDALCATRAAHEEGFIAGGGCAFMKCLDFVQGDKDAKGDQWRGFLIVRSAIMEPFEQILRNAGKTEEETKKIGQEVVKGDYGIGFNVKSDKLENLFDAGVIDPTKVARCALENAASIAAIFLTTECVVADPMPKEYSDKGQTLLLDSNGLHIDGTMKHEHEIPSIKGFWRRLRYLLFGTLN